MWVFGSRRSGAYTSSADTPIEVWRPDDANRHPQRYYSCSLMYEKYFHQLDLLSVTI